MAFYTVTNKTKSPRVVYPSSGKTTADGRTVTGTPVIIKPGQSRPVSLDDGAAKRFRNRRGGLKIDDYASEIDQPSETSAQEPEKTPSQELENVSKVRARELIANVDEMAYGEWQSQAKDTLGDKWPGGTPRKAAILELLMAVN